MQTLARAVEGHECCHAGRDFCIATHASHALAITKLPIIKGWEHVSGQILDIIYGGASLHVVLVTCDFCWHSCKRQPTM